MKSLLLSAFALILPLTALAKDAAVKTINLDGDLYTKANMRYDAEKKTGSYIQYLKLSLLPANSKVRVRDISKKGFKITVPDGETIQVEYKQEWGGKPVEEILPDLFSEKGTAAGIAKLSELDRKGVRSGRALVGMSKAGVIAALGLPAAHKTPSIEADLWTYWANRFVTFNVVFKNGRVEDIGSAGR
jgi:hypothetical protein